MLKWIKEQPARARVWLRERKEAAEAKKLERQAAQSKDQHAHSRFFLLTVPAAATVCAATVEWYWAILFCIAATGKLGIAWATATGSSEPTTGSWHFEFSILDVSVLVGLIVATLPIVMLSMVWLPVQFAMRGAGRWRRGTLVAVGILANILVIVSGVVVMNMNRQEHVRAALVTEQTAGAQRAMLQANVDGLQHELDTLMNHRSTYVATAASVGAAAYERNYVAQARATNDPRLPQLERALGSARRADELRAQILAARQTAATAAPEAATQANVQDDVGAGLNTFAQYVEVYRPPFVALICTLIGIFGAWWVVALLEGLNPRDVLRSGWADEGHRIEDLREEAPVAAEPMKPAREVVTDAETGEELIRITPKPHWRKAKGKKQRVETQPDIPPDETGVSADGGGRIASALTEDDVQVAPSADDQAEKPTASDDRQDDLGGNEQAPSEQAETADAQRHNASGLESSDAIQPEPSEEPTQEELAAYMELESAPEAAGDISGSLQVSEPEADPYQANNEPSDEAQQEAQDEAPVQPRALLAAAE